MWPVSAPAATGPWDSRRRWYLLPLLVYSECDSSSCCAFTAFFAPSCAEQSIREPGAAHLGRLFFLVRPQGCTQCAIVPTPPPPYSSSSPPPPPFVIQPGRAAAHRSLDPWRVGGGRRAAALRPACCPAECRRCRDLQDAILPAEGPQTMCCQCRRRYVRHVRLASLRN